MSLHDFSKILVNNLSKNEYPYDKFIILGTFCIIILSNTLYIDNFLDGNRGINSDWNFDEDDIFGFATNKLLKTTRVPELANKKCSDNTADFDITINNSDKSAGFKVHFDTKVNSDVAFDETVTKKKFNKDFINLAQVFYETGFCNFEIVNTDSSTKPHADFDDVKKILLKRYNDTKTPFTKSLKLIYYKDFVTNQSKPKLKEENFKNYKNIFFEDFRMKRNLKKNISLNVDNYKQNIIVYDVREIQENKIKKLIGKFDYQNYYLLIIINDNDKITGKLGKVDNHIQILQLKFNSGATVTATPATATPTTATPTATTTKIDVKTVTFNGCEPTGHQFTYFETKDSGSDNIKLIEYKEKDQLDKILDYFIKTNNIVLIETR